MTDDPTVLDAVDALAVELGIGANGLAFTWDQLEALNGVLAAHAHELAEKIRTHSRTLNDPHGRYRSYVGCGRLFADLIDPEVTS